MAATDKTTMSVEDYLKLPYTIQVTQDESEGYTGWFAKVEELPGCMTQADTFDELGEMIEDAKRTWSESALEDGNEGDGAMVATRVADMSVDELKSLIQETVTQTLMELFRDPDKGLELREDFQSLLQHSLAAVKAGGETITADNVAAKLGLSW